MAIRILYFAALREALGKSEEELSIPETVRTVADLSRLLERSNPALQGLLGSVRFAVNETFVDSEQVLSSGDVVALIPPVSGG